MISSRSPLIWGEEYDPVIAKQDFIKMPYPLIMGLAEVVQDPAVAVLSELIWQSFTTGKSCFRYSSARLDRYVKRRGLAILEREKWITVEQERGKAPLVSLRWMNQTRASGAQNPAVQRTKPGRPAHKTRAPDAPPLHKSWWMVLVSLLRRGLGRWWLQWSEPKMAADGPVLR